MTIETRFTNGQQVNHVTEPEGQSGIVTAFMARGANHSYEVQWDIKSSSWHLDFELVEPTKEKREIGWRTEP